MKVGKAMSIGEIRHRITLQSLVLTTNDNGFEIESWQEFKTVWSKVSNLSGREYYRAASIQEEQTVKFTIRYLKGLTANMRILFEDRQYNIISVDNIKYEGKYIEIKALEVDSNG
jgi:SPP1 family predicted phage head-tail adaptor